MTSDAKIKETAPQIKEGVTTNTVVKGDTLYSLA